MISVASIETRAAANAAALARLYRVRPQWTAVVKAGVALGLPSMTLLHAGPAFRDAARPSQPVRSAAVLCCLYEGWAHTEAEAHAMLLDGRVRLLPAQDFNALTPLAAVISPSTALVEISDGQTDTSRRCWSLLGSGSGPQLRFGTRDPAVLPRLHWRDTVLFEALQMALAEAPVELFDLALESLAAGEDLHSNTTAATASLWRLLEPRLGAAEDVIAMLKATPSFFLTLWMGACHLMLDAAANGGENPAASLVVALAGNGEDAGVRLAGAPQRWLCGPAPTPQGPRMASGFASPMLGDSGVIDAAGFGAQAWAHGVPVAAGMAGWLPGTSVGIAPWRVGDHPLFSPLGLSSAIDAAAIGPTTVTPRVAIAMLDIDGRAGLLGRGLCVLSAELFAAGQAQGLAINASAPLTQLQDAFERYEAALTSNDLAVLDELFWHSAHTLRYGPSEHLYGIQAIQAFRQARPAAGLARQIVERSLITFGDDFAVTHMVFARDGQERPGRQTQSWVRLQGAWRIVAAHVSSADAVLEGRIRS